MTLLATKSLVQHIEPIEPHHLVGDKIQPGHPLFGLIWINPARVSGAPCFYATRVPIRNLFDSIAAGETLDEFLDGFEGVTREQGAERAGISRPASPLRLGARLKVLFDDFTQIANLLKHFPTSVQSL